MGVMVIVVLSLVGCRKVNEVEYYRMLNTKRTLEYGVDMDKYKEAILFLASSDSKRKNIVVNNIDKYKYVIDKALYNKLLEGAIDESHINTNMENMDNIEEDNQTGVSDTESGYPIYDSHGKIIGYGTKEESENSLKAFKEQPENIITSYSIIDHGAYIRLDNKYIGEYLMYIEFSIDGQISNYRIYR